MKAKLILLIGLFFIGFSMPTEAQVFKKLGKKIEQKVKDRVDRKEREADQKVDQKMDESMDKAEQGAGDAVLDWINGSKDKDTGDAGAAAGTPGTPATDLPQGEDYTLEVKGSGPDLFLVYTMDTDLTGQAGMPAEMGDFDMSLKLFAAPRLNRSRSEVVAKIPIVGEMTTAALSNMDDPSHIVMINDKKKAYSVMDLEHEEADAKMKGYRIEVVGKEVLHGISTTHFKIITEAEGFVLEMWTSKDLPGYNEMIDIYKKSGQMGDNVIWDEIIKADADGFLVRMQGQQEGAATRLDLQHIEQAELSDSLFEIPANYKKKKSISTGLF